MNSLLSVLRNRFSRILLGNDTWPPGAKDTKGAGPRAAEGKSWIFSHQDFGMSVGEEEH